MMKVAFEVACEEVLSLIHQGVEEFEKGEASAGASLLIEAQFLLGEVIQQQLNNLDAPPLSPLVGEGSDEEGQAVTATMS